MTRSDANGGACEGRFEWSDIRHLPTAFDQLHYTPPELRRVAPPCHIVLLHYYGTGVQLPASAKAGAAHCDVGEVNPNICPTRWGGIRLLDAELAKLRRVAERKDLPLGTAAYEIVARALARQR